MKYLLLISVIIGMTSVNWWLAGQRADAAHQYQVMSICTQARTEISHMSEEACGDAQDRTHTEFLCNSQAINAHCWVEVR